MDKNIPRGRIMRDETLADIASHPPREQHDLAKVRGLSSGWKDNDIGRRLMQTLADAKPLTEADAPARAARRALGKEGALVADLLKLLLKIRSREIDVAARLLARSDDLEALAAGQRKGLALLESWRFDQFGRDALELVEGKLAFAVVNGKLKMAHIDDRRQRQRSTPAKPPAHRSQATNRRRMSTYLPTLKQLQYLVALHEHGHFGKAADRASSRSPRFRRDCANSNRCWASRWWSARAASCASPRWATRWSPRRTACCARPRNCPNWSSRTARRWRANCG
jgi:hypothetical protein